eukprot:TRINITY_DN63169_c0_g1_i1.p3 TRINITY_DN63169_c0_g1~~TRINITY_DN63169_c0_g1_i1.p3  ORF type:complete len:104 (-),score=35.64 TRINITY_DN63169_c0_g1_i1:74-385(-)
MIRRPPRSTQGVSSAASDVYKRQGINAEYWELRNSLEKYEMLREQQNETGFSPILSSIKKEKEQEGMELSLIHISEPTRPLYISYAVFCLKKKKNTQPILQAK